MAARHNEIKKFSEYSQRTSLQTPSRISHLTPSLHRQGSSCRNNPMQLCAKFVSATRRDQQASGLCSPEVPCAPWKRKTQHGFYLLGFLFWRRPIDSLAPASSPAARAGLTVYVARRPPARSLTAGGVPPRRATSWRQHRNVKTPLR
jgi:hypothetical protein